MDRSTYAPGDRVILTKTRGPFVPGDTGEILSAPPYTRRLDYLVLMDEPREGKKAVRAEREDLSREVQQPTA